MTVARALAGLLLLLLAPAASATGLEGGCAIGNSAPFPCDYVLRVGGEPQVPELFGVHVWTDGGLFWEAWLAPVAREPSIPP